ncbi:hypothetical protein [Streptomyces sp. NRRL F-5193]|uniref:hypothetical protein n=1 Tax=Streptomyces sp. NRRL F-5193 TaxID=1463860 RepID=UPI0005BBB7C2|nr:hypothetical protein [Streptomyces sp. NRRL F-5193]
MRTLVALPAFYAVSRAPQLLAALVGIGLALGTRAAGASLLGMVAVALLGLLAVRLACTLPVLRMSNGGRRAVRDACWQAADAVADWARWTYVPSPDDSH